MNEALSIRQALEKHKRIIQPIKGSSMLPMLDEDKDAVELVAVQGRLKKFDLPLYQRRNGQLVLHRIIAVKKNYYLICGDNSTQVEKVPMDWIVAVASGFYKDGKYVSCQDGEYLAYVQERWKDYAGRTIIKKLPNEWKAIISLYRMAVTGREMEIEIPENLSWDMVYAICKEQMIGATVYPILDKVHCPERIREKFRKLNQQSLHRWLLFSAERKTIYADLAQQKIPHMSLKGILYGLLYPSAGMREMADNDVLIHPGDAQAVTRYMTARGYRAKPGWVHISYYKRPFLNFELHTALFKDAQIEAGFRDVWERAKPMGADSCECEMSDEDVYLHAVAHFHKHYYWGGTGLRAFADLYLLCRQEKAYDTQYIDRKLEIMGLREFAAFYKETTAALFDGDLSTIADETIRYIFESGAFGTVDNRARNGIQKQGVKKYFWSRVFLTYPNMCRDYPCLIKFPFLLPVFWIVRLVNSLLNSDKRKKLKIELTAMAQSRKNGKEKNG